MKTAQSEQHDRAADAALDVDARDQADREVHERAGSAPSAIGARQLADEQRRCGAAASAAGGRGSRSRCRRPARCRR